MHIQIADVNEYYSNSSNKYSTIVFDLAKEYVLSAFHREFLVKRSEIDLLVDSIVHIPKTTSMNTWISIKYPIFGRT